jgi:hypothetical protein
MTVPKTVASHQMRRSLILFSEITHWPTANNEPAMMPLQIGKAAATFSKLKNWWMLLAIKMPTSQLADVTMIHLIQ